LAKIFKKAGDVQMKKTSLLLLMICLMFGCTTLDYRPGVHPLPEKWFNEHPHGQGELAIINVTESETGDILEDPGHAVISDKRDWGDDICEMTEDAFRSLGYSVADVSDKVIQIDIDYVHQYPRPFFTSAVCVTHVKLGDGTELTVKTINRSGVSWKRGFYGVAMKAAYEIATHPQVVNYLRQ